MHSHTRHGTRCHWKTPYTQHNIHDHGHTRSNIQLDFFVWHACTKNYKDYYIIGCVERHGIDGKPQTS